MVYRATIAAEQACTTIADWCVVDCPSLDIFALAKELEKQVNAVNGTIACSHTCVVTERMRAPTGAPRGMAWVFVRYAPADSPPYAIAEGARAARRGLWVTSQLVRPWEWRSQ